MMNEIGFGGGCHWCTEAIFQSLRGVKKVDQGWIRSHPPYDTYSEAARIQYDPEIISLATLIEIHLLTHSSTSNHPLREKYRSAIYTLDEDSKIKSLEILNDLKASDKKDYITRVLPMVEFKLNEEQFLDYYKNQPDAPFCKRYIHPKLKKLRAEYANFTK
jgi:peptide-methionine (S)-S-oxide reductase